MEKLPLAIWHNLPPGGAKRALSEQAKRLSRDFDIDLYTTTLADDKLFSIEPYCRSVTKYPITANPYHGWKKIKTREQQADECQKAAKIAAAVIDGKGYGKVLVHPCQIEHSPSVLRFLTTPTVYYCHEPLREVYEPSPINWHPKALLGQLLRVPELRQRKTRDREAILAAKTVLVNSRFIQQQVERIYGVTATVCYLGVDVTFFQPGSAAKDYLLSVGRLTNLKGHDFVIELSGRLPKKRPVRIIADVAWHEEWQRLEALAHRLGVPLTISAGVRDEDLLIAYQQAVAVVCAQHREPFGFVPLEAMSCARPVFAVAEGGFLETIEDKKTGFLLPRNPEQAAIIVERVLDDPQTIDEVTRNALESVRAAWSWGAHYDRLKSYVTD